MAKEYKDKTGAVIDLAGVDEKVVNVVGLIVEGQMASVATSIQEAVATAVGKVVTEQIKPLADKVEGMKTAEPKKPGEGGGTGGGGGGGEQSDLLKALNALTETVNGLKTEREGEKAAATSRGLAEQFVTKHRPNLKGKEVLIKRIADAGVKTEDDARKVAEAWDAEMKTVLGEEGFKSLSASPQGEGAKEQPKGGDAETAAAKEKLLKDIKERETSK